MLTRDHLPAQLSDWGTALAAACLIAGYLVVAEPYVGYVLHTRFERAARRAEDARRWLYRRLLILEWGLAVLCLAAVALAPGVDLAAIGVRLPWSPLGWVVTAVLCALAAGILVATVRASSSLTAKEMLSAGGEHVVLMLPRTPVERRLFSMVAVTAGCCEELVFRGFLTAVAASLVPAAPVWVCALAATVVFALAHVYQGASGIIMSLALGMLLAAVYVVTGSLIAAVVVHALIDLRAVPLGGVLARDNRKGAAHGV